MGRVLTHLLGLKDCCLDVLHPRFVRWTKPFTPSLLLGSLADLGRSKSQLIAENALLRKPLIILSRQVKRPAYRKADRMLLVLLARLVRTWKQALFIVQPETLLRWHRELFRLVWKRRSKVASHQPKIAAVLQGDRFLKRIYDNHSEETERRYDRDLKTKEYSMRTSLPPGQTVTLHD